MSFQNDYIKNDEFPKISKTNRNLTIPNEKNPKKYQSQKVDINIIPRNKIIKNKNEFKKKYYFMFYISSNSNSYNFINRIFYFKLV
jgi:hypothetical protein